KSVTSHLIQNLRHTPTLPMNAIHAARQSGSIGARRAVHQRWPRRIIENDGPYGVAIRGSAGTVAGQWNIDPANSELLGSFTFRAAFRRVRIQQRKYGSHALFMCQRLKLSHRNVATTIQSPFMHNAEPLRPARVVLND